MSTKQSPASPVRPCRTRSRAGPTASTRGYGGTGEPGIASPVIAWSVGGVPVPATTGDGTLEVPTAEGTFTVPYDLTLDPSRLILLGRGGERYAVEVKATATEPQGAFGHVATATFDPVGWTEGFGPEDIAKLNACMTSRFKRVHERERDWILPVPTEDPGWGRRNEQINVARINEIASRVQLRNPEVAADLVAIARLRLENLGPG